MSRRSARPGFERILPSRKRRVAPYAILVLAALGEAYVLLLGEHSQQARTLVGFAIALAAAIAWLLWFLLFSALRRSLRLGVLFALVLGIGAFGALVRVRGVTGDFVPILEPRWLPKERIGQGTPVPAATAAASTPPGAGSAGSGASASVPPPAADGPVAVHARPQAPAPEAPTGARDAGPAVAAATTLNDYPQFLGPDRDGTLRGARLFSDWSARPPRLVWKQPIGLGWSAFAIAGGRAVTQEQRAGEELVSCYELMSGRLLWSHADPLRFESVIAGDGPRAAPTIDAGRVFTMGSTGLLNALDLASGRRLWSHDVVREHGGHVPDFGKVTSPLVVRGLVVVSAGGGAGRSLVAYRAEDGALAWSAGDDSSSYSSPALMSVTGEPQVVIFNMKSVAGHDPETGRVLWEHAWPAGQPNVAQPLALAPSRVLFSAGYGIGSKLFEIARVEAGAYQARVVWETTRLKSKFVNVLLLDGFLYGLDDGVFSCIDAATGERKWRAGRYGHGQMILVEKTLLVQTEEGELVLVEPSPDGLVERARHQALDGKTWNPPALAMPYLLVRNDKEAALYELPLEARP